MPRFAFPMISHLIVTRHFHLDIFFRYIRITWAHNLMRKKIRKHHYHIKINYEANVVYMKFIAKHY